MLKLNLPEYKFKIVKEENTLKIFDEIRKKYLVLTPEEWVRQNIIRYLISEKGYKASLIGIEKSIKINGSNKRFDIVLYNSKLEPYLLVECKAPNIKINEETIDQIAVYNSVIKPKYMLVTNGLIHICFKENKKGIDFLRTIPEYNN